MNKKKHLYFLILIFLVALVATAPSIASAAFDLTRPGVCSGNIFEYLEYISNRAGSGNLRESNEVFYGVVCAIEIAKNTLFFWISLLAVFYIAMSGISYILAAGNEAKTKDAMKKLQAAVIGYLAFLCVILAVNLVSSFLQYDKQVEKFKEIQIDLGPPT